MFCLYVDYSACDREVEDRRGEVDWGESKESWEIWRECKTDPLEYDLDYPKEWIASLALRQKPVIRPLITSKRLPPKENHGKLKTKINSVQQHLINKAVPAIISQITIDLKTTQKQIYHTRLIMQTTTSTYLKIVLEYHKGSDFKG